MKKTLLEVAHDIATDIYQAGGMDAQTMHYFDLKCLPVLKNYSPAEIKKLRLNNKVSQSIFAAYLNASLSTIRQWEQGVKRPSGIALKILNLVDNHGLLYLCA